MEKAAARNNGKLPGKGYQEYPENCISSVIHGVFWVILPLRNILWILLGKNYFEMLAFYCFNGISFTVNLQ